MSYRPGVGPPPNTFCNWLDHGAPLGYNQDIPSVGISQPLSQTSRQPICTKTSIGPWKAGRTMLQPKRKGPEPDRRLHLKRVLPHSRLDGGSSQGVGQAAGAEQTGPHCESQPEGVKKRRLIWDLRESKANAVCCQGERILLPRLLDLAQQATHVYRQGEEPWLAAIVKDAFMNIPSGPDKSSRLLQGPTRRNLTRWRSSSSTPWSSGLAAHPRFGADTPLG